MITKRNISSLIIDKNNKFLLVKRSPKDNSFPNLWELPGGGIDNNEDRIATVRRETMEEVGIDLKDRNISLVDTEDYNFKRSNGNIEYVREYTFLIRIKDQEKITLSKEHTEYSWVNINEIENLFEDKEDLIYVRLKRIFSHFIM